MLMMMFVSGYSYNSYHSTYHPSYHHSTYHPSTYLLFHPPHKNDDISKNKSDTNSLKDSTIVLENTTKIDESNMPKELVVFLIFCLFVIIGILFIFTS